jgi:streptogramin lyase
MAGGGAAQAVTITEFPTPPGAGTFRIAPGPDGNLWFTYISGTAKIGRINPSTGHVDEFSTDITSLPWDITAGPDGNVWFTEQSTDLIGRINPSTGHVDEFPATTNAPPASPEGITTGPDGNLWFTEGKGDRIGRITPSGDLDEFSTNLTNNSGPEWITPGPDGNLWFTEGDIAGVGRITPSGDITEFKTGLTATFGLEAIVTGPDGNLWFAEAEKKQFGRLNPAAGHIDEFPGGSSPEGPEGLTVGPDGNFWFTDPPGAIGRRTLDGVITDFSSGISPGAEMEFIVPGPDGSLWFTDSNHSSVGRVALPPGVVTGSASSITTTSATLNGVVQPLSGATNWHFDSDLTAFRSATPQQTLPAGAGPVPVSASLTGLTPLTTYHYRLVASNAFGATNGQDLTFATAPLPDPVLSRVSMIRRRFRLGRKATPISARRRARRGSGFRYRLSEAATVTIRIYRRTRGRKVGRRCRANSRRYRHRRRCTRLVGKGRLTRRARTGRNTVRFSGRIGRRALKPGRYQAKLQAANGGALHRSRVRTVRFTILRG